MMGARIPMRSPVPQNRRSIASDERARDEWWRQNAGPSLSPVSIAWIDIFEKSIGTRMFRMLSFFMSMQNQISE